MHECQEIWSANINQKEDHFLIYERDLLVQFDQMKLESNSKYIYWLIGLLAVTCIISVILLFLGSIGNLFTVEDETDPRAALGVLGDYFGGMLNPILAFLSFIALLVTLSFQSKQLRQTEIQLKQNEIALQDTREAIKQNENALQQNADALKINNKELENSTDQLKLATQAHQAIEKTQKLQQFENLFTHMIGQLNLIYNDVEKNSLKNFQDNLNTDRRYTELQILLKNDIKISRFFIYISFCDMWMKLNLIIIRRRNIRI